MHKGSDKAPGERVFVTNDFAPKRIASTASIVSVTAAMSVLSGEDADPSAMLDGDPEIAGTLAGQWVIGGLSGVQYKLSLLIVASDGSKPEEMISFHVTSTPRT